MVKKNRMMRSGAGAVTAPSLQAVNAVTYPVSFRTRVDLSANSTGIWVFAPYNDTLAGGGIQATYPADGTVAVLQGFAGSHYLVDPYLTSVLTPSSTTATANEPCALRCTSFCVEMSTTTPISLVNGDLTVGTFNQNTLPVVWGNFPSNFKQLSDQMDEDPYYTVLPAGQLVNGVCHHAFMRDRQALEFTNVQTGASRWNDYWVSSQAPAGVVNVTGANYAWSPIVIRLAVPNGTYNTAITFQVKATFQITPPVGSAWSRLARPIPVGGSEARWWALQQMYQRGGLQLQVSNALSRDASGVLGLPTGGAAAMSSSGKAAKRPRRRREPRTTTKAPKVYDTGVPSVVQGRAVIKDLSHVGELFDRYHGLLNNLATLGSRTWGSNIPQITLKE